MSHCLSRAARVRKPTRAVTIRAAAARTPHLRTATVAGLLAPVSRRWPRSWNGSSLRAQQPQGLQQSVGGQCVETVPCVPAAQEQEHMQVRSRAALGARGMEASSQMNMATTTTLRPSNRRGASLLPTSLFHSRAVS